MWKINYLTHLGASALSMWPQLAGTNATSENSDSVQFISEVLSGKVE